MKAKLTLILMAIALLFTGIDAIAKEKKVSPKFEKFWTSFQKLVEAGDKDKIANLVSFGAENPSWSSDGTNPISSKSDFIKKFDKIFTPEMKAMIKKLKAKDFIRSDEDGYNWYKSPGEKPFLDFCDLGKGFKLVNSTNWK